MFKIGGKKYRIEIWIFRLDDFSIYSHRDSNNEIHFWDNFIFNLWRNIQQEELVKILKQIVTFFIFQFANFYSFSCVFTGKWTKKTTEF